MTTAQLTREEMMEPIERLFEREIGGDFTLVDVHRASIDEQSHRDDIIDMLYLAGGRNALHSVRLESSFDTCIFDIDRGILSLRDMDANATWIALPLDELRQGDKEYSGIMEDTCVRRGIGIIGVHPKGRGISAKVIVDARFEEGDFLEHHPGLEDQWRDYAHGLLVGDGYRVVEYYDR